MTSQPIGRAHTFTREDFARILAAMGYTVDSSADMASLARRINHAVCVGNSHRMSNLRALRKESGYAEAMSCHPRGWIKGKGEYFAGR